MTASDNRKTILTNYVSLLVEQGARQATLDAVAKMSGYSKAGLIYYFSSRAELDEGLLDLLQALVKRDIEIMQASPDPAEYYLMTSLQTGSELERTVAAATRLAQQNQDRAKEVLRWARGQWLRLLEDHLGDPILARLALLTGDGMSHQVDIAADPHDDEVGPESLHRIAQLIGALGKKSPDPHAA